MKDIREIISSSINLYLGKVNIYKDQSVLLVEYIQKKFIKINDEFYLIKNGLKGVQVSDEDMEWAVETFTERLYYRMSEGPTNISKYVSAKIVDLAGYRELKNNR
ncbi:MAG: hypothetical protein RSB41_04500 [Bacilli bacterium]